MGKLLVSILFVVALCTLLDAQPRDRGTIRISIPLFPKGFVPEATDDEHYALHVRTNGKRTQIPFAGRTPSSDQRTKEVFDVDRYEIQVRPGTYSIEIENVSDFKLPNFEIVAGQVIDFTLPQNQFAWRLSCDGKVMVLWTNYEDLETPTGTALKPVQVETITLEHPSSAVIYHCGKSKSGQKTKYESGRIYFGNHYFSGVTLEIDRRKHRLVSKGAEKIMVDYVVNGSDLKAAKEITFDYGRNSVVPASEF